MSYPGILQAQPLREQHYITQQHQQQQQHPQQQQQQQQLIPGKQEAIEMRPTAGFIRLPQDPPMQPSRLNHQMETTMLNGMAMHPAPEYNPPTYSMEDSKHRSQLPYSQHNHNYEELPYPRQPGESSTDEVVLREGTEGFERQGSHTEVDQYFNPQPPVHSISSTQPVEKKPRKKVNPIYDRYEGPTEKVTTSKEGYQRSGPQSPPSKGRCPVRCLRHPITTVFIFVLVAVVIIALVLIMLGKIETPASNASSDTQVQPKVTSVPTTASPDSPDELLRMIQEQHRLIEDLQSRIGSLEAMLGGAGEVNASLSTKVAMNTIKIDGVVNKVDVLEYDMGRLQTTVSNTLSSLDATKARTTTLENGTRQLENEIQSLRAVVTGQGGRINSIENKNTNQDTTISTTQQDVLNLGQRFDQDLSLVNRTIYGELDTISKMQGPRGFNGTDGAPGPEGPPGAGDLSMCDYQSLSTTTSDSSIVTNTFTRWLAVPQDKIITGVTCSTDGGTFANLQEDTTSGYRCRCSGSDGSTERKCYLHYWRCPATS